MWDSFLLFTHSGYAIHLVPPEQIHTIFKYYKYYQYLLLILIEDVVPTFNTALDGIFWIMFQ